jgi:hypothetical protein
MEKTLAFAKLLMAGSNTGAAVHTGDVTLIHPWKHVHKAGLFAALAVCAFISPCHIHPHPKRDRADPSEEHLHQTGSTDIFTERMAHQD